MSRRKFSTLRELEEYWDNDLDLTDADDPGGTIDIVELPPDRADDVSDLEDIDDNILEDTIPNDVPGSLEIHGGRCNEEVTVQRKKKPKKEKPISRWKRERASFNISSQGEEECEQRRMTMIERVKDKRPVEIFEMFFTDDLVNHIVQQSVSYATQNNRHQFTLSSDCFKKFLGFLLLTGYHSLPQEQMYWSEEEDIDIGIVRKCMSKNRYIEIKRNLHFSDNTNIPLINGNKDRLFKIRPILDELNKAFMQFGVFSYNICIDEQRVRYYGHHFLKQFIRGKPIRFGFKQWAMCCGVTGYCYNADIYEGKPSRISEEDNLEGDTYGLGVSVILNKIATIDKPEEHCFYFDNFFTSFDLLKNLKERNIPATGTVRCNRMNKCPIKTDKEMKKEFRGAFDYRYDEINGIFGLVWKG
ncbi:chimeric ERCC6-PGBD3 protein [Trichonephila clavata]|uniref:Chimeric ERCC6-PGBD3 protein n=1 Tax=Trichonephila clavata TaxID=2740835 RepID=A0A8X6KT49_TRICU|nr:chimeric ERCC6-PGBD3 protein [Trichonephila clavata]